MKRAILALVLCLAPAACWGQATSTRTDFVPKGAVRVTLPSGEVRAFRPDSNTDAERWESLTEAIAYATATGVTGGVIEMGPGTFDAGSAQMATLPDEWTLRGAGRPDVATQQGGTLLLTASGIYPFIALNDGCEYADFGVVQDDPTALTPQGAPIGLPENNTADCTGWALRNLLLIGDIDGFFVSGSGDFALHGRLYNVTARSGWDAFRINNNLLTEIDIELHACDFQTTGDDNIHAGVATATGLSINAAGGAVRAFGGVYRAFNGNTSSAAVINEGSGCTITLVGCELESTPPDSGFEMDVFAVAPVIVAASVKYDPDKTGGAGLTLSPDAVVGALSQMPTLSMNPKFADATSAAGAVAVGGNYTNGNTAQVRVYTYRTIDGTRRYSDSHAESNSLSFTAVNRQANWTIVTEGDEDGIKIVRNLNAGGWTNASYREVADSDNDGSYVVNDLGTGWTNENPVVVTPLYDERLRVNYWDGSTRWALNAPALPATVSSLTLATDLSVANGGTGAGTAAAARTALGTNWYLIHCGHAQTNNPADATDYWIAPSTLIPSNVSAIRLYPPRDGALNRIRINSHVHSTLGSAETATLAISKNGGAYTNISTTVAFTAYFVTQSVDCSGLGISHTAGDYYLLKLTTPTWATNPLQTQTQVEVEFTY